MKDSTKAIYNATLVNNNEVPAVADNPARWFRARWPARSATIRYNRIAYWKREEICGICTSLQWPLDTPGIIAV